MSGRAGPGGADRAAAVLFLVAAASHALRVGLWPEPGLWDPSYYRGVARHLLAGEGAVTGAVWTLLQQPPALPMPADLYWMPLPSRVLLPGLALWPAHGDALVSILLAAAWAPLARALALGMGAAPRAALGAGLAALVGGLYARQASLPDCFGLVGALGGLGFLAVQRGRWEGAALVAALVALSRSDGALFGLALALGLPGRRALPVAAAGVLASLAWLARGAALAGEEALALRSATARAPGIEALLLGQVPPHLGLADRAAALLAAIPAVGVAWLAPGAVVVALLAAWGLGRGEGGPLRRPLLAWWLLLPPLLVLLAPGAAHHGAIYRSGAAAFPALCALASAGLADLNRRAVAARAYHPAFLPALLGAAFTAGSLFLARASDEPPLPDDLCAPLAALPPGAPIFAWHPLAVDERCGHPAVVLLAGTSPAQAAELAARHGLGHALLAPPGHERPALAGPADMPRLLPGWREAAPGLWRAPGPPPR
ncbi:hypothetical protein L6R53_16290 [Myxococcota bacterium]|nr:hypothetical protein [Myxococcota bacterium]